MSKRASYAVVAIVAFLVGGFSFRLVGLGGEAKPDGGHSGSQQAAPRTDGSATRVFALEGMTCQGCVDTITTTLTQIPGVRSAKVSLQDKQAVVVASESDVPTEKIVAAVVAAGYQARPASAPQSASVPGNRKQPILVNITRGKADLHAVSMALGLAYAALKDGRPAAVFLNVEAPVFAAKTLGDDVKIADFPPVKKMIADFIAAGGRVLVCGHCTHVVKLKQSDLVAGAKILTQVELFAALQPGTVVFSY